MLRRDIHQPDCTDIIRLVDGYAEDDAHASVRYLDRRLCLRCAKHWEGALEPRHPIPQPQAMGAPREM